MNNNSYLLKDNTKNTESIQSTISISNCALLLIGNIRTFESCIHSFENICKKFNPDIFICMSNRANDLHPFIQDQYNYYSDVTMTSDQINNKFDTFPFFSSKIKKLIILDKEEENLIISNNYLHLFNSNKTWIGLDIFKQFYKLLHGIELIEKYEQLNNIKYDYIIKSRFDVNIDINTFPINKINNDDLFVPNSSIEEPCDHIFITNNLSILKSICVGVKELFMSDTNDKNIIDNCKSIHTMLGYICKNKKINIIPTIKSFINRNYNNIFNTDITIVTAFYDIGRSIWNSYTRSNDIYFTNCEKVLKQRNPIYIFTTENFKERIINIRKKTDIYFVYTKIIIIPFEDLKFYNKKETINNIQNENNKKNYRNEPEFTQSNYIILIFNKLDFLLKASNENLYYSQYFQWVDFGIHNNILKPDCSEKLFNNVFYKQNKIRMVGFIPNSNSLERNEYYPTHMHTVSGGLFGGDASSLYILNDLFDKEVNTIINLRYINQEQYIFYWLLCKNPDLFDYYLMNNWDELGVVYFKNSNLNIAVCFSGHLRTYENCALNINDKIIKPLTDSGINVYTFLSTWDKNCNLISTNNLTDYEIEESKEDFFLKSYTRDNYNSKYSGKLTCPNSISMLYKMNKVYKLANEYGLKNNINYDVIIRIRPDVIYDNFLSTQLIKESLNSNNTIYMPNHHGKYIEVTKYISDQFFFGNTESMKKIMTIYQKIDEILTEDFFFTGEGFIDRQINHDNIINKRFMYGYGFLRESGIYEKFI